ncbi:hypothetical protein MRB53_027924 [Persea americana]|uniref:Uncharacterized protein n=1 Tax=Persea americana TaxID=3435 RepID=A0ACC2KE17_PERAE|nr:hypothetical protein MRB53_027924 [Persea americana]
MREEALREWLTDLKYAAYDAEDVLDKFSYQALRFEIVNERKIKVCGFFLSCVHSDPVFFRGEIGRSIKVVRERLDEIAKDRADFHLKVCHEHHIPGEVGKREKPQPTYQFFNR